MQSLKDIKSKNRSVIKADGRTQSLTGLSASTSDDNVISSLPTGHGIEVGDKISFNQVATVTFINYRTYARRVIEISDSGSTPVEITDVVPWASNATYDIEVAVDGGSLTSVSFTVNSGDTWADVIVAVNAGLSTAGLAATAYFNSVGNLWAGGVISAEKGILIRSNLLGTGSAIDISIGTVNDFYAALSAESYNYHTNGADANGVDFDIALAPGVTFVAATTYNVSGPIYNSTFTTTIVIAPGVTIINPLTPSLFTNGYTTQDSSDLSADTPDHSMAGTTITGTITISNINDVTYSGTPITIASITTLDRIKKHYIENGNLGIGTDEPQYPLDIRVDASYKGNPLLKNNHEAVSTPTSSDDNTLGYSVGSTWIVSGSFYICTNASTGNASWQLIGTGTVTSVNGDPGPGVVLTTSEINEGSNLYYTDTRFDDRLATKTTDDLPEGTNLYFSGKDTDDLSEGTNNKYVTQEQKDEFHADHTNRSSIDLLEISSPQLNDTTVYNTSTGKIENKPIYNYAGYSPVDYTSDLPESKLQTYRSYINDTDEVQYTSTPQLNTIGAVVRPYSVLPISTSNFFTYADENYIFYQNNIRTTDGNLVDITGLETPLASSNTVFKVGHNLYVVGDRLVRFFGNSKKIIGVPAILPNESKMLFVLQTGNTTVVTGNETRYNLVTLDGWGGSSPVFKSYSVNFTTGTVTLVTTLNYSSLPEYDAGYTQVRYTLGYVPITRSNGLSSKEFTITGSGWDGAVMEGWATSLHIHTGTGVLTHNATSSYKIPMGGSSNSRIEGSFGATYGLIVTRLIGIGTEFHKVTNAGLVIDTVPYSSTNQGIANSVPYPFPTKAYPHGFIYVNTISGSQCVAEYHDADSKVKVVGKTLNNISGNDGVGFLKSSVIRNDRVLIFGSAGGFYHVYQVSPTDLGIGEFVAFAKVTQSTGQSLTTGIEDLWDFQNTIFNLSESLSVALAGNQLEVFGYGLLQVNVVIRTASSSWGSATSIRVALYKNSIFYSVLDAEVFDAATTKTVTLKGTDIIKVALGDVIDIRLLQDSGSTVSLVSDATYNYISACSV